MFSGEKNKLISDKDLNSRVGKRFEAFRRLFCLTRDDLAAELDATSKTIEKIEKGETLPDLSMLDYLHKEYGLSVNWLINGHGDVILNRIIKADVEIKTTKQKNIPVKTRKTIDHWELMKVPAIENIIFGKLEEVKLVFKDQIDALKRCQQLTNDR